jgi:hypothetical protein
MRLVQRGSWKSNPIIPSRGEAEFFTYRQLERMEIDALKDNLRRRIGGYGVAIKDMPTTNRLYRGVQWRKLPSTVDDLSYPPPEYVKKLGRANRERRPMFYASVGAFPVFFEIHAKQGDLIALSEWGVVEPLWMHNLGYHSDALERMGAPVLTPRLPLTNPIPNETNRNRRLRRRMSLAFTADVPEGEEYRYKETIAINELLFARAEPIPLRGPDAPRGDRVAGTVYPAVQMRGLADNVAIWPEFVDRYLRIRSVRYVLVEAADEEKADYTFLTIAYSHTFSDKAIVWHNNLPPESELRTRVVFEDGHWVFRTGLNEIYAVH